MAKKHLGRGLNDPLGETEKAYTDALNDQTGMVCELEIDSIVPNPMQPRKTFDPQALQELSDSIREYGILQPILVCENNADSDSYVLVSGERRLRAAKLAGQSSIKAIIIDVAVWDELRELALIENIQREDLNPLELAQCYKELIDKYHFTHDQLAQKVAKSRAQITNTLRLLNLEESVAEAVLENKISQGHAKSIASLAPQAQQKIAKRVMNEHLSVRETEDSIRKLRQAPHEKEWIDSKELKLITQKLGEKGIALKATKNCLQFRFENKQSVTNFLSFVRERFF